MNLHPPTDIGRTFCNNSYISLILHHASSFSHSLNVSLAIFPVVVANSFAWEIRVSRQRCDWTSSVSPPYRNEILPSSIIAFRCFKFSHFFLTVPFSQVRSEPAGIWQNAQPSPLRHDRARRRWLSMPCQCPVQTWCPLPWAKVDCCLWWN